MRVGMSSDYDVGAFCEVLKGGRPSGIGPDVEVALSQPLAGVPEFDSP
jgi:hypothetical protein